MPNYASTMPNYGTTTPKLYILVGQLCTIIAYYDIINIHTFSFSSQFYWLHYYMDYLLHQSVKNLPHKGEQLEEQVRTSPPVKGKKTHLTTHNLSPRPPEIPLNPSDRCLREVEADEVAGREVM